MARISFVSKEQASPEALDVFKRIEGRGARVVNLYRILLHSPEATLQFMRLGNYLLLRCPLDRRLRELAILRIAKLAGSRYEWVQHVPLAMECGMTREQVEAIAEWRSSTAFDSRDRAVLAYTDEVAQQVQVQDDTFQELARHLDEQSIVELTLSVGYWGLVARLLEALKVDMDPEMPGSPREMLGGR